MCTLLHCYWTQNLNDIKELFIAVHVKVILMSSTCFAVNTLKMNVNTYMELHLTSKKYWYRTVIAPVACTVAFQMGKNSWPLSSPPGMAAGSGTGLYHIHEARILQVRKRGWDVSDWIMKMDVLYYKVNRLILIGVRHWAVPHAGCTDPKRVKEG